MVDDVARQPPDAKSGIWKAIVERARDLVILTDEHARPIYLNPAIREALGFEPDELIDVNPLDFIHPDDRDGIGHRIDVATTEERLHGAALLRVQHRDGSYRWLEIVTSDQLDDPELGALVVNGRDVTRRVEAERRLADEIERYRVLVEAIPDMVARFDCELNLLYLNPAARAVIALVDEAVRADPWASDIGELAVASLLAVAADGQQRSYEHPITVGGSVRWYEVTAVAERASDGTITGLTTIARDITNRKVAEQDLRLRMFEDPLTGLVNRAGFHLVVKEALREAVLPVAVLYLDIDHFKLINDGHGHGAGDDFLREAARRLRGTVRPGDVVARLGGDEFAIHPLELRDLAAPELLAGRLHDALADLTYEQDGVRIGSASIGVAVATKAEGLTTEEIIARADGAMYEAKRAGRGRTVVATSAVT